MKKKYSLVSARAIRSLFVTYSRRHRTGWKRVPNRFIERLNVMLDAEVRREAKRKPMRHGENNQHD